MTCSRILSASLALAMAAPAASFAQQPQPAPQPVEQGPAAAPYAYDAQGRRDPFVSLVARGTGERTSRSATGPGGLLIGEITVKGIVRDRSGFIAMIQGPDTKTFIVRSGEKLLDGAVKAITADTVVFSQEINDPLSLVKQKEVRKTVRPADGGRG
jgi:Tfp pilus assembly protein PilP